MNDLMTTAAANVPAFLANRKVTNTSFLAGLPTSISFPMIGLKGTRFVVKAEGTETVLPTVAISVVLIEAKGSLDKAYYASKYDPNNTEAKSPDCFSKDGVRPDAASTLKQCDSCAGCPMNQYGSGTDQNGNPGKGKACAESKMLAIFANNGVYGFKIPAASLKPFSEYARLSNAHGVDLTTCITEIGFDPACSFPKLTFEFKGFLNEEQYNMISAKAQSKEVLDIIGSNASPVVAPQAAPVSDPFAQVAVAAAPVVEKPKVTRISKERVVEVAPAAEDNLDDIAASLGITL